MYECLACVFGDQEPEEDIKYPGTEVLMVVSCDGVLGTKQVSGKRLLTS